MPEFEQLLEWAFAPFSSLADFFDAGGPVLLLIFGAAVVLWSLILDRLWFFRAVFPQQRAALRESWQARGERQSWHARRIREQMISEVSLAMGASLPVMKMVIPLCPLLGLLGTVAGMLEVFDVMSLKGRADAQTMASGISHAMVCTMAGLAVSLSGIYPVQYFESRLRRETDQLNDVLVYE